MLGGQGAVPPTPENPGQMYVLRGGKPVPMPLERTTVNADVAGMGARVSVTQSFVNTSETPIEAIYTFPLPHDAAIDSMRISVGNRVIRGEIMRREKARQVYDAARQHGQVAALLDQETDNIFTQSVANIMPGKRIEVEISYVQVLKFEDGEFEFTFPMVVGERFLGPGTPNPQRISPPVAPLGTRTGQTIGLHLTIRGGSPIQEYQSVLHRITAKKVDKSTVHVDLVKADEIPNRDFIFRYRTATTEVQESLLTTWDKRTGGYFALVLAPPQAPTPKQRGPKEMVFVLDQSGSQAGFPIEKSKELCYHLLDTMGPDDMFNVMGFANEVNPLWPGPRPNTPENQAEARAFIKSLNGDGGTELEKAIVASLSTPPDPKRLRIVLFNTDGYAGQEPVILSDLQMYRGMSRMFTFGIGNSVNRSLIDAMSYEGRGASEIVTLEEDGTDAAARFAQRMSQPLLVNVQAQFDGGTVDQVTPAYISDVFSARPVVIYGRYSEPGKTRLTLSGLSGGQPWGREIELNLPRGNRDGSEVASLWARQRIAELKSQSYTDSVFGRKSDVSEAITQIALDHRIMSEFTSFVAIDSEVSNKTGAGASVRVPVEPADGVTMGLQTTVAGSSNVAQAPGLGLQSNRSAVGGGRGGKFGGGGGFGGGGLDPNSSIAGFVSFSGQGYVPKGVDRVTYDPTENSLVLEGQAVKTGHRTVEIPTDLLRATGPVDIRVTIPSITPERLAQLRKAGFTAESHDGIRVVFGTANADAIRAIAKLPFVQAIDWLRNRH